jgi:hypothetical protein
MAKEQKTVRDTTCFFFCGFVAFFEATVSPSNFGFP